LNDDLFCTVGESLQITNNGDIQVGGLRLHDSGRLTLSNQGILFVYGDTLRRSSDNGSTWSIVHNGLPFGQMPDIRVHSNGDIYVARKGDWLFRSSNNGDNWIALPLPAIPPPPPGLDADAIAFGSGGNIYVGDDWQGFFRSTNSGSSWEQLNNDYRTPSCGRNISNGGHFAGWQMVVFTVHNGGTNGIVINTVKLQSKNLLTTSSTDCFPGTQMDIPQYDR
jgi:hypothetical protein